MSFLLTIIIAIGLSMDSFSLSLSYGMFNITKNTILKISTTVGLFHFIMPLLGNRLGIYLLKILPINSDKLIGIIFIILIIELLLSIIKKEEIKPLKSIIEVILFSFAVSIDSFTTGIGIDALKIPKLFIAIIFMIISSIFTFIGLSFGRVLNEIIGDKSKIIGILILLFLSIKYLLL